MSEESIPENQIEIRLREISEDLGITRDTINWVYHCICILSERDSQRRDSDEEIHVSGREICTALVRDIDRTYSEPVGEMLVKLKIPKSEGVGRIAFSLADKKLIAAGEMDSAASFEGVFDAADIGSFMREENIASSMVGLHAIHHLTMWFFYITGTILVLGSYVNLVSPKVAWFGWGAAMLGFVMQFVRLPERRRF